MKHKVFLPLVAILLVISGCTVISARNYSKSLAVVTLTSTVSNSIRSEMTVTGQIYYKET